MYTRENKTSGSFKKRPHWYDIKHIYVFFYHLYILLGWIMDKASGDLVDLRDLSLDLKNLKMKEN